MKFLGEEMLPGSLRLVFLDSHWTTGQPLNWSWTGTGLLKQPLDKSAQDTFWDSFSKLLYIGSRNFFLLWFHIDSAWFLSGELTTNILKDQKVTCWNKTQILIRKSKTLRLISFLVPFCTDLCCCVSGRARSSNDGPCCRNFAIVFARCVPDMYACQHFVGVLARCIPYMYTLKGFDFCGFDFARSQQTNQCIGHSSNVWRAWVLRAMVQLTKIDLV